MTYEELAEKAEMSRRYLKEIENGAEFPVLS
ncbi:helix-turn-helix domain-containing protein [Anaerobutyricum hallii]|nr:helix-turn-helix domain-containing protein [Anaerobutyricum hallii]